MQYPSPRRTRRRKHESRRSSVGICALAFGSGFAIVLVLVLGVSGASGGWPAGVSEFGERLRRWNPFAERDDSSLPMSEVEALITAAGQRHNVPPDLLWAMVAVESQFEQRARSSAGAMGLMQLKFDTAREMGVRNPFNPVENIDGGAKYIAKLLRQYRGEKRLALAAYNAGPAAVQRHRGVPPFTETKRYVTKVLKLFRERQQRKA